MNRKFLVTFLTSLLVFSFANAGLYKWVDEKGEVHFSDKVPVAASRKAVSEINKHGAVTKTVDPEALAQARLEFEENTASREKQEALDKVKREELALLKKRDDYLLSTYENKQELITSFESKINMIKGNEAILKTQNTVLSKRLKNLKAQMLTVKQESKKIQLNKRVVKISSTIAQYDKALVQNKEERMKLSKNYEIDIKRYIELTQ